MTGPTPIRVLIAKVLNRDDHALARLRVLLHADLDLHVGVHGDVEHGPGAGEPGICPAANIAHANRSYGINA